MPSSELQEILGGPLYVGPVTAVKQEYQVFRTSRGDFVVFSKSNRSATSFHMTFVPATKVEGLMGVIPKGGTTSGILLKQKKVGEIFPGESRQEVYFEVLTTLYVLAALNAVEISKSGRNLVFTPRVPAAQVRVANSGPTWAVEGDGADD